MIHPVCMSATLSGHRSVKNHRSKSGLYKLNVSDGSLCLRALLKVTKIFYNSKSAQIPTGVVNLVSYCVYDVDVSIVATSVTLEH